MRASSELFVIVKNDVAVFAMFNRGWMEFIGGSGWISLRPSGSSNSAITITAGTGNSGVVVIKVTNTSDRQSQSSIFMVPINWIDAKMVIDLDKPYVSRPDRLLQVNSEGQITVTTPEFTFTAPSIAADRKKLVDEGHRLVDDPNLLCRFVVGQATLADLEAAATLDKRDQIERDLAQAQIKAQNASAKLALVTEELRSCQALHVKSLEENEVLRAELKSANMASESFGLNLINLQNTIFHYELLIERIREAIQNIGDHKSLFGWTPWVKVRKVIYRLNVFAGRDT